MSLNATVVSMVKARPGSNVDDLLPSLPEFTRKQVMAALQNVAFYGRLQCKRQGVKGQHKGAKPGRYYPVPEKPAPLRDFSRCVTSVWQLGSCA